MEYLSSQTIREAIAILADPDCADAGKEFAIRQLVKQPDSVRRLCDLIPEAFGMVLVSHLQDPVGLPEKFHVPDKNGKLKAVPVGCEPVLTEAILIAQQMFHQGPRRVFQSLAESSAIVNAVNRALNAGGSLKEAKWDSLQFPGMSADWYPDAGFSGHE